MVLLCKKLWAWPGGDGGSYSSRRLIFPAGPAVTVRHSDASDTTLPRTALVVTSHINHAARGRDFSRACGARTDPRLSVFKRWRWILIITQATVRLIFYEDPTVLTVSIHRHPDHDYPFHSGFADQTGAGAGLGTVSILPLAGRRERHV
jgi:hypothetical protein